MTDILQRLQIRRWPDWLAAAVMMAVPFHAFLTVWISQAVGHFMLLRLWDELALAALGLYVLVYLWRNKQVYARFAASQIGKLIGLYVVFTLLLGLVALAKGEVTLKALTYALIINLRFLVWFAIVWVLAQRSDWLRRHWRQIIFWPLAVVVGFGLLQFFILPHDFLQHFGYNGTHSLTYVDGLTLNQDSSILRVQSTLRGSNQLGAYLVVALTVLLAIVRPVRAMWRYWVGGILVAATLFLTFSRSSWLGMLAATLLLCLLRLRHARRWLVWGAVGLCIVLLATLVLFRNNNAVQNVILHESDKSTAKITSNEGHASAFKMSVHDLRSQPLGDGPGTAGQASIYNTNHTPRNTESNWLQLSLEVGVAGVLIFAAILYAVGSELWALRADRLTLGLFIALIGLVIVNFFAYGWADDTLAFTWWGFAGIALAKPLEQTLSSKPGKAIKRSDLLKRGNG